jgi:lysophospholipase L1-like esterase
VPKQLRAPACRCAEPRAAALLLPPLRALRRRKRAQRARTPPRRAAGGDPPPPPPSISRNEHAHATMPPAPSSLLLLLHAAALLLLLLLLLLPARATSSPLPPPPPLSCHGARGALISPNGTRSCDFDAHGWRYTLTPPMLRRAMAYTGSAAQLRALAAKLNRGAPIVYSAIGGSVTRGHGAASMAASDRYTGSFSSLFFGYVQRRWPAARHTYVNGGVPATGSVHFAKCVHNYVHATSDVVTLDFAVNDFGGAAGTARSGEAVLRRLARSPHRDANASAAAPAFVFVSWHADWEENAHRTAHREPPIWAPVFLDSPEEGANALAQYYDVAHVSLRDALFAANARRTANFSYDDWQYHGNHPNARGHAMMADALVYLLDSAAREEAAEGLSSADDTAPWRLPDAPLLAANAGVEAATPLCYFGRALALLLRASSGWAFDDDARAGAAGEKPGFVAQTAGATLDVRLPPPAAADKPEQQQQQQQQQQQAQAPEAAQVALAFLRAPAMTRVSLSCVRGCACDTQVIAGDGGTHGTSTMEQHPFAVTHATSARRRRGNGSSEDDDGIDDDASLLLRRRPRACVLRIVAHGRFKVMGLVERRFAWTQLPFLKDTHATTHTSLVGE